MAEMKEGGRLIKSDGSIVPRISLSPIRPSWPWSQGRVESVWQQPRENQRTSEIRPGSVGREEWIRSSFENGSRF